MRIIDMQTWPRRKHFDFFMGMDYPHFNLCANVDITNFYPLVKERGAATNIAIIYLLAKIANNIPEFRYRIKNGQVVEHEVVHPASTILAEDDIFSFCTLPYTERFDDFAMRAAKIIEQVKKSPTLDDGGMENLLFMTAIPWVSFTSIQHPIHMRPVDSVPRIAWGKFFSQDGEHLKMPLAVQAHHALMDGLHAGRYFEQIQAELDNPKALG